MIPFARLDDELATLATLSEPARRRLFDYVSSQADAVSRDAAAQALGMTRSLVAFHLDRLVASGLLDAEFRRLTGRSGPGAGRPSKLYRRSAREIEVSLPEGRYRLAAGWLAEAFARDVPTDALRMLAHDHGEQLGKEARLAAGEDPSASDLLDAGVARLSQEGFAARRGDGEIRLNNCPFDAIAREHRDLVCHEMNRSLLEGFAAGLGGSLVAAFEPRLNACCMVVR